VVMREAKLTSAHISNMAETVSVQLAPGIPAHVNVRTFTLEHAIKLHLWCVYILSLSDITR